MYKLNNCKSSKCICFSYFSQWWRKILEAYKLKEKKFISVYSLQRFSHSRLAPWQVAKAERYHRGENSSWHGREKAAKQLSSNSRQLLLSFYLIQYTAFWVRPLTPRVDLLSFTSRTMLNHFTYN